MTKDRNVTRENQPRFIDALCSASITLWFITSIGFCISFINHETRTLWEAIIVSFFSLFTALPVAFILSGIVSLPLWVSFQYLHLLSHKTAPIIGVTTGFTLTAIYVFIAPFDYAGTYTITSAEGLKTISIASILGGVSGWNGYRFALNGRRIKRKKV